MQDLSFNNSKNSTVFLQHEKTQNFSTEKGKQFWKSGKNFTYGA